MVSSRLVRNLMCAIAIAGGFPWLGSSSALAQTVTDNQSIMKAQKTAIGSALSAIENKRSRVETALHFVNNLTRSTLDTGILSNDFMVWTASAGYFNREKYLENLSTARSIWKEPLEFSISLVLERQNCVVIEATSSGVLFTGDHYGNEYLFVIDFDADDKIRNVREYYDVEKIESIYRPAALKWKSGQTQ